MPDNFYFHILDQTDSSNNYAMQRIRAGLAKHGEVWFAREQFAGKGQFDRKWVSEPGENILMSIVIEPPPAFYRMPFSFNMTIATGLQQFLQRFLSQDVNIKWPNDLMVNDRKAGGLLIENLYRGDRWTHAVVGIGINVNQNKFEWQDREPISFSMLTGLRYDPIDLSRKLAVEILQLLEPESSIDHQRILEAYNATLYKKNEIISLLRNGEKIEAILKGVDESGRLIMEFQGQTFSFTHGEVGWGY